MSKDNVKKLTEAIAHRESGNGKKGAAARNNNPGNIKVPYKGIAEARRRYGDPGAQVGSKALDGGNFIKFSTMEIGKKAIGHLLLSFGDVSVEKALRNWSSGAYGEEIINKLK